MHNEQLKLCMYCTYRGPIAENIPVCYITKGGLRTQKSSVQGDTIYLPEPTCPPEPYFTGPLLSR